VAGVTLADDVVEAVGIVLYFLSGKGVAHEVYSPFEDKQ
jgi:hypothetical protein